MKTKYFFLAAIGAMTLASCSNDELVGDNSPTLGQEGDGSIQFTYTMPNATRADIYGKAAADLLGNNFYVTGTKGTEQATYPSPNLVFDNYLVHFGINTAGTTESNTANWEYVGIDQGAATPIPADYKRVKLSSITGAQTIKYWDYSAAQYDFLAFSTGKKNAVKKTDVSGETLSTTDDVADTEIGVTEMKYGSYLAGATAYTFYIPTIDALKEAYITDITTVANSSFGNEVTLQFKNLGSKLRLALYETVPGYSVDATSVRFYTVDKSDAEVQVTPPATNDLGASSANATLISANATYGFPEKGIIEVSFPNMGTSNKTTNQNYNKASVSVTPKTVASPATYQEFGPLAADKYAAAEGSEAGSTYLGRSLPNATYAGVAAVDYYEVVFPVTGAQAAPLTLRVDYTLVSTDGSGETIKVYGAKAVVPSTYTVWQPNYAYTYIFKISDNTNGWTTQTATAENQGLYPITFDAVVAEIKDVSGEQTTITTVATPTITTYQQNHDKANNEYSNSTGKNVYVQVMDNKLSPAVLVGTSPSTLPKLNSTSPYTASLLYAVTSGQTYTTQPADWPSGYYTDAVCNTEATGLFSNSTTYYKRCTEADVMDALQNQTSVDGSGNITGRNGVVLTKNANITTTGSASKFDIENGADDKKITVNEGDAAKIVIGSLSAGTYAYVYDYSASKSTKTIYQPTGQTSGAIASDKKYITTDPTTGLGAIVETTSLNEAPIDGYVYFSKTTTDGTNYTYSFVSVDDKDALPADLLKVSISTDCSDGDDSTEADANTFVLTNYTRNDGKYAVKVIKVVD